MRQLDSLACVARKATWTGLAAIALAGGPLLAESRRGEDGDDSAGRAAERAMRDGERTQAREVRERTEPREPVRQEPREIRTEERAAEERAKIMEDAARDEARTTEDLARVEADRQIDTAKVQEDAAKDAADLAEDQAKAAEDAAKYLSDAEEDAAKEAADLAKAQARAAEDAARDLADTQEDTADAAEDSVEDRADYGSSEQMRDLAEAEQPDFDTRGFPVRRGEVVALDMGAAGLELARQQGFRVVSQDHLPALDAQVTRLAAPEGIGADEALRLMRAAHPEGTFDLAHYYGLQLAPSGGRDSGGKAVLPRKKDRLTIGMIDTAVASHSALAGVSITRKDFAAKPGSGPAGHGTAIASILASEGSRKLYSANIFRGGRGSRPFTSADALVEALEWMMANKVRVVNISLAGPRNIVLDRLISRAISNGMVIVAAAGNGGPTAPPAYPAAVGKVLAVTAVDGDMRVYRYANQGRYITVAAPGVLEPAADDKGGIAQFSGTSFATPHVAAWMARCMKASDSPTCARQLRSTAMDLGEPGFDPVYGYGLIR
jgi:subtilisin family serine protease